MCRNGRRTGKGWRHFSFLTKHRVRHTCEPCWHNNCEIYTCHCQGFEKSRNLGGKGVSFGTGVAAPFVACLTAVRRRAPTSLNHGSHDRRVVAASSISLGVRSLHNGCGCLVVASSYSFTHGRQQANEKHCQEEICVRRNARRQVLFELPHENTWLEALHFHGEAEQFKVGLPFALSKLSKQSTFQTVKRVIGLVADI